MLAIDFAWWRPDPNKVKAAGYDAIIRYVSHDLTKSLTKAELEAAHAAGLGVGVIFEDTARRPLGGAEAGNADGIFANQYLDSIGWPKWKPCGYAADFDVDATTIPTVLAYIEAADAQGRKAFGYGESDLVDALVAAGIPDDWQACAWSHGIVNNKAALYQRLRPTTSLQGSFDEDVILHPSNDLWFPGEQEPQPAQPPKPTLPSVTRTKDDQLPYMIRTPDGEIDLVLAGHVIHLDGPGYDFYKAQKLPLYNVRPQDGTLVRNA